MARLTRKNIKVFAGSASNNGIFGSLQANNPVKTNDVEQLQSLSAWEQGWNAATETSEELPPLEEIQGVTYVTTYEQAYLMQEGLPEWASTVIFYKGSLTKEVTANGFRIYCSLTDNNTNNLLSDTANWKKVMDSEDLYAFDSTVVHKTGNETIADTKTFSSSPIVPTATAGDNSTKAASTEFVTTADNALQTQINAKATPSNITTAINNLLNTLFPVGAVYQGKQSTCPLATLMPDTTWTKVATKLVTNVDSTVGVKGTGKTLGLTNGSTNVGMAGADNHDRNSRVFQPSAYNKTVSSSFYSATEQTSGSFGVVQNVSTSGLTGVANSTTITINLWERTA